MQAQNILEWQFYHNSLRAWLVAGIVFVVIAAVLVIVRTLLARRLEKIAQRTATTADDAIVDLLRRTRYFFILTAAVAGAKLFLDLPEIRVVHACWDRQSFAQLKPRLNADHSMSADLFVSACRKGSRT